MKFIILILIFSSSFIFANEEVRVQLHWKHQFQYAGFYAALEKGYYKNFGIDVKLKE